MILLTVLTCAFSDAMAATAVTLYELERPIYFYSVQGLYNSQWAPYVHAWWSMLFLKVLRSMSFLGMKKLAAAWYSISNVKLAPYLIMQDSETLIQMLKNNNVTVSEVFVKHGTNISERSDLFVSQIQISLP